MESQKAVCGNLREWSDSKKYGVIFGGALAGAGLVLSTLIFPFWHLIRSDVYEDVEILASSDGVCYATTSDNIPKKIQDCHLDPGAKVKIKFGEGLAWATLVEP